MTKAQSTLIIETSTILIRKKNVFQCNGCESTYHQKKNLHHHMRKQHGFKKSRKAEICHIRFFINQNPCLGMAKSLSWAVTKNRVEVRWAVTKYQVGSRCGVVS